MLEGLRNGTETCKEKARNNYKTIFCKECSCAIKYRPMDVKSTPSFCSKICYKTYMKKCAKIASNKASEKIMIEKKNRNKKLQVKIDYWCKKYFKDFKNLALNNLQPLFTELSKLTNLKDARSIMAIYGITSKRKFFKELSKRYADQV